MTQTPRKKPEQLRSQQWFGRQDRDGFAYRSWLKGKGIPHDQFEGRPVIGICNTFSELTPCNSHFRTIAEQVKIGEQVLEIHRRIGVCPVGPDHDALDVSRAGRTPDLS